MGWSSGTRSNRRGEIFLKGPGTFRICVVGESRYQKALSKIVGGLSEDGAKEYVRSILLYEDENPHDSRAIRVEIQGMTVGYLSRKNAAEYRARLKKVGYYGAIAECNAVIAGGWDRGDGDQGMFGVRLDLPAK